MAKFQYFILFAAVCFLSTIAIGYAHSGNFVVQGRVYCDTCRAGFETTETYYMGDAKVKIECRNFTTGIHTFNGEASTDPSGTYKIDVAGDHEDEMCDVKLVSSPKEDCKEIKSGRDHARILLTDNSGLVSNIRYANSMGFFQDKPRPDCAKLLASYVLDEAELP